MDVLLTVVVLLLASNAVQCCSVTKILPSEASINVTFETDVKVACRIDNCQHVHALYNYTLNETKKEGWIDLPNCMDLDVSLRECKSSRNFTNEQFNQTHLWCQFKNSRSTATQILIQSHLDQVRNVSLIRKSTSLFLTWKSPQNLLSGLSAAYHVILSVGGSTLFKGKVDDTTSINLTNRSIDGWLPTDPCVAIDCNITAVCGTVESSMSHSRLYYPTEPPFNDSTVDIQKTDNNGAVAVDLTLIPDDLLCNGSLPASINISVTYIYADKAVNFPDQHLLPKYGHGFTGKVQRIILNGDDLCNMSVVITNAVTNYTLPNKKFSTFDVQDIRVIEQNDEYCLRCIFAHNSSAVGCAIQTDEINKPVILERGTRKCLRKPDSRNHVEVSVRDVDSDKKKSPRQALSTTIYFTANFETTTATNTPTDSNIPSVDQKGFDLVSIIVSVAILVLFSVLLFGVYLLFKKRNKIQTLFKNLKKKKNRVHGEFKNIEQVTQSIPANRVETDSRRQLTEGNQIMRHRGSQSNLSENNPPYQLPVEEQGQSSRLQTISDVTHSSQYSTAIDLSTVIDADNTSFYVSVYQNEPTEAENTFTTSETVVNKRT